MAAVRRPTPVSWLASTRGWSRSCRSTSWSPPRGTRGGRASASGVPLQPPARRAGTFGVSCPPAAGTRSSCGPSPTCGAASGARHRQCHRDQHRHRAGRGEGLSGRMLAAMRENARVPRFLRGGVAPVRPSGKPARAGHLVPRVRVPHPRGRPAVRPVAARPRPRGRGDRLGGPRCR